MCLPFLQLFRRRNQAGTIPQTTALNLFCPTLMQFVKTKIERETASLKRTVSTQTSQTLTNLVEQQELRTVKPFSLNFDVDSDGNVLLSASATQRSVQEAISRENTTQEKAKVVPTFSIDCHVNNGGKTLPSSSTKRQSDLTIPEERNTPRSPPYKITEQEDKTISSSSFNLINDHIDHLCSASRGGVPARGHAQERNSTDKIIKEVTPNSLDSSNVDRALAIDGDIRSTIAKRGRVAAARGLGQRTPLPEIKKAPKAIPSRSFNSGSNVDRERNACFSERISVPARVQGRPGTLTLLPRFTFGYNVDADGNVLPGSALTGRLPKRLRSRLRRPPKPTPHYMYMLALDKQQFAAGKRFLHNRLKKQTARNMSNRRNFEEYYSVDRTQQIACLAKDFAQESRKSRLEEKKKQNIEKMSRNRSRIHEARRFAKLLEYCQENVELESVNQSEVSDEDSDRDTEEQPFHNLLEDHLENAELDSQTSDQPEISYDDAGNTDDETNSEDDSGSTEESSETASSEDSEDCWPKYWSDTYEFDKKPYAVENDARTKLERIIRRQISREIFVQPMSDEEDAERQAQVDNGVNNLWG